MQKLLDVSKLSTLGWKYSIPLETGLQSTFEDFVKNYEFYKNKKHKTVAQ